MVHAQKPDFVFSAKRTSPFKSAGASVQSNAGSRGGRISGCNAGYNMFRGSVKGTGYPLHSPVFPSLPHPCVFVCHHISTGVYHRQNPVDLYRTCMFIHSFHCIHKASSAVYLRSSLVSGIMWRGLVVD